MLRNDTDERGVSPVIGVILMVAITVILAAVIASFVIGLGGNQSSGPNTAITFDYDSSNEALTIEIGSGESLDPANVNVKGGDVDDSWNNLGDGSSDLTAGDSITLDSNNGDAITSGESVTVTYTNPNNDNSYTLNTWEGPDA